MLSIWHVSDEAELTKVGAELESPGFLWSDKAHYALAVLTWFLPKEEKSTDLVRCSHSC